MKPRREGRVEQEKPRTLVRGGSHIRMRTTNRYLFERFGGRVVDKNQLKEFAEIFNVGKLDSWINYLINREYIVRIFRGGSPRAFRKFPWT